MTPILRPIVAGVVGGVGVALAWDNLTHGPLIVGVASVLVVLCLVGRERGGALAALGIGAAGAFSAPGGLGPLLVAAGVLVACDVGRIDRRLEAWRDVIDATIALPALAGLAGTVAAQPSQRAVALGVVAAAAVGGAVWRAPRTDTPTDLALLSGLGLLGGFVVALAPDRVAAFGELPSASVQAARSVSAALGVFLVALLVGAIQRESGVPRRVAVHRRS